MSEAAPQTSEIATVGTLDHAAEWARIVANYDKTAPDPLGMPTTNVYGHPSETPPEVTVPGVIEGQLIAAPSSEPVKPATETALVPWSQPEAAKPDKRTYTVRHIGSVATDGATPRRLRRRAAGGGEAERLARQALDTAQQTQGMVGLLARRLGVLPPTGRDPDEPQLKGSGLEWGFAGRKPYGTDPYSRVVKDPTVPPGVRVIVEGGRTRVIHDPTSKGGERLVVEEGRISSRDDPRALNPRGTHYKYYGVQEGLQTKNADAKGVANWATNHWSRSRILDWKGRPVPLSFKLRKWGTNLIPGGWIGDGWRGRRNKLVDPLKDFYTKAEEITSGGKVKAGQLRTRTIGRHVFTSPLGARAEKEISVPVKTGERRRIYYSRGTSYARPSSNRSM